ncbi:MAG TPA: hypothetical protein VGC19_10430 [Rhodanobacter sp.]
MKSRKLLLSTLIASSLMFGSAVFAQDAPPPAPAPDQTSATNQTPQGQVTVNSSPAPAPTIGPAPSFEQLSGGGKSITEDQAAAYPPLANDFINADSNRNGKISKSEYEHWLKQPQ